MQHEHVTERIITAAMTVHSALGAGLLESTYHACLQYEMNASGLEFEHQLGLPVVYRSVKLDIGYRIDFPVEKCVIVELKAVEKLLPIHTAQVLSYMKLTGCQVGLLLNFNAIHLRQGIRRIVNAYPVGTRDDFLV